MISGLQSVRNFIERQELQLAKMIWTQPEKCELILDAWKSMRPVWVKGLYVPQDG